MAEPTADVLRQQPDVRCPSCAAALRAGAPWCTLCYADLRPTAPSARPASGLAALDPLTAPAAALGLPDRTPLAATWPCTACGADNPLAAPDCGACGAGFLAGLRSAEGPLLELPVVGDLGALSRSRRLLLAAGLVLAVVLLATVLGLLVG